MTDIIICTDREIANAIRDNTGASGFTKIINDDLAWVFDTGVQDALDYLDDLVSTMTSCMGERIVETTHHVKCEEDILYSRITAIEYSAVQEGDELLGMDMVLIFSNGVKSLIPIC